MASHPVTPESPFDDQGLPLPYVRLEKPFVATEYAGPEYKEAKALEDAITLRGAMAQIERADPQDFLKSQDSERIFIGYIDLFLQSTWLIYELAARAVEKEKAVAFLAQGTKIYIDINQQSNCNEIPYVFHLTDGSSLPLEPYHDYDDLLIEDQLNKLAMSQRLVGIVQEVDCQGENGIAEDPDFCWRIYSIKTAGYICRC